MCFYGFLYTINYDFLTLFVKLEQFRISEL